MHNISICISKKTINKLRKKIIYVMISMFIIVRRVFCMTMIPALLDNAIMPRIYSKALLSWKTREIWLWRILDNTSKHNNSDDNINISTLKVFNKIVKYNSNAKFWRTDYLNMMSYSYAKYYFLPFRGGFVENTPESVAVAELSHLHHIPYIVDRLKSKNIINGKIPILLYNDWRKHNFYPCSLVWRFPMVSAIRAFSLLPLLLYVNNKSPYAKTLSKDIWHCVNHLLNTTMENKTAANNHRLLELSLLPILLAIYKYHNQKTYSHVVLKLIKEAKMQYYSDGYNKENSTGYHALTLESMLIFVYAYHSTEYIRNKMKKEKQKIEELQNIINKAVHIVSIYMKCYGRSPNFGDSSDTRIMIGRDYYTREIDDHSYILRFASLLGIKKKEYDKIISVIYARSGYGFFSNGLYGACMNAAVNSGVSGHAHNDKCSWVLQINGEQVFVDPGTYMYHIKHNERNYYRSTRAHNTIQINNEEQAQYDINSKFSKIQPIVTSIRKKTKNVYQMKHEGYKRLACNAIVQRTIKYDETTILINDEVLGKGSCNIRICYLLHPAISVKQSGYDIQLLANTVIVKTKAPGNASVQLQPAKYSSAYGQQCETTRIEYLFKDQELPFKISYIYIIEKI